MPRLVLFLLCATWVTVAPGQDAFSEAFGKPTRRHVEQVSSDPHAQAGACYRVLQRLPACTSEEWELFRKFLQPMAERVLRTEGFTETSGSTLELDGTSSIIRVVALKPSPVESSRVGAKRIHLIVTRTEDGEILMSYEVREQG